MSSFRILKTATNTLSSRQLARFTTTNTSRSSLSLFKPQQSRYSSTSSSSSSEDQKKQQKKQGFFKRHAGKFVGATVLVIAGSTYAVYYNRHPPQQLPHDPSKKTIAILGSGWAATSLLTSLDTENYNVVVVSPRNYFLFTPLLPSCTVGTIEPRSIMQPLRHITRFKTREVQVIEANCTDIDPVNKTITITDESEIQGETSQNKLSYDYLVMACGAENATFGIPGVREFGCFLKEIWDARKIRTHLIDSLETAAFPGQSEEEMQRLLHMVVVGGGPTGVEYAGELYDFLQEDIVSWYPDLAGRFKITLIEALPRVLPMFHKELIEYTEQTFATNKVDILTNTMVKEVREKDILVKDKEGKEHIIPYGLLVWAAGNTARPITRNLMSKLDANLQNQRRGLVVDEYLSVKGAEGVFAIGDCSATKFAPTAQVASQQGRYLGTLFAELARLESQSDKKELVPAVVKQETQQQQQQQQSQQQQSQQEQGGWKSWMAGWWIGGNGGNNTNTSENKPTTIVSPLPSQWREKVGQFSYSHWGSLAYIGGDSAIADLPYDIRSGGKLTYLFWRSAYLSNLFSLRNKVLVGFDWVKKTVFGRDIGRE